MFYHAWVLTHTQISFLVLPAASGVKRVKTDNIPYPPYRVDREVQ